MGYGLSEPLSEGGYGSSEGGMAYQYHKGTAYQGVTIIKGFRVTTSDLKLDLLFFAPCAQVQAILTPTIASAWSGRRSCRTSCSKRSRTDPKLALDHLIVPIQFKFCYP